MVFENGLYPPANTPRVDDDTPIIILCVLVRFPKSADLPPEASAKYPIVFVFAVEGTLILPPAIIPLVLLEHEADLSCFGCVSAVSPKSCALPRVEIVMYSSALVAPWFDPPNIARPLCP